MAAPFDGQPELYADMEAFIASPGLDAEGLGRLLLVLDRFAQTGSIALRRADRLLDQRDGTPAGPGRRAR